MPKFRASDFSIPLNDRLRLKNAFNGGIPPIQKVYKLQDGGKFLLTVGARFAYCDFKHPTRPAFSIYAPDSHGEVKGVSSAFKSYLGRVDIPQLPLNLPDPKLIYKTHRGKKCGFFGRHNEYRNMSSKIFYIQDMFFNIAQRHPGWKIRQILNKIYEMSGGEISIKTLQQYTRYIKHSSR